MTGPTGFIGSSLCRRSAAESHEPAALVELSEGYEERNPGDLDGDIGRSHGRTPYASAAIGYGPRVAIEEGVRRTVERFAVRA